jgi:hypothetical protein
LKKPPKKAKKGDFVKGTAQEMQECFKPHIIRRRCGARDYTSGRLSLSARKKASNILRISETGSERGISAHQAVQEE